MSLNFSNKCLETLKQKNIDGEMIRNWVKKTTDAYFNQKTNKEVMNWSDFQSILDGEFWNYYLAREESITNINSLVVNELRKDKNLKIGLVDFGPLYPLGPNNQRWQNGVNLNSYKKYEPQINNREINIGYIGMLETYGEDKGVKDAFLELKKIAMDYKFKLTLIGGPQEKVDEIVKEFDDTNIESVSYTHLTLPTTPYV